MSRTKIYLFFFFFQIFLPICNLLHAAPNTDNDTVYILVMRPKIVKSHTFNSSELEKIDIFNEAFRLSFQQQFQVLSGKQCSTYYQVIDYESKDENGIIRDVYDIKESLRRPHYDVNGGLHRETDGYRLYLKMVGTPDDLIKISHIVFFLFSQADDTQTASLEGIKAAQIMLSQLCGNQCQPNVVNTIYDIDKNIYYQKLKKLFELLKIFIVDSEDADKMDNKISKLMSETSVKQDEMFLSHSIIQATYWKNVRSNPEKSLIYLTEAKEYYCRKNTSYQDLDLVKNQLRFDQFDEFIQKYIETCTTRK